MRRSGFILLAVLAIGCQQQPKPKENRKPVAVAEAVERKSSLYIEAIANLLALNTVELKAQVTGNLITAHIEEGKFVKKGDLVYTIDPAPFQASLEKAKATLVKNEAALRLAKDKVSRYTPLVAEDYVSKLSFSELETDLELKAAQVAIDRAEVAAAEIALGYCYICSPVEGKLSYNTYDPGNLIIASDTHPINTVRQINPILVVFSITQRDLMRIKEPHNALQTAFHFFLEGSPLMHTGTISFIDNKVNLENGTVTLRGIIPNENLLLWPGAFGKVRLPYKELPHAVVVPEKAVQYGQQGAYLFVHNDDQTVSLRQVAVEGRDADDLIIGNGVKAGERVVTEGQAALRHGAAVFINERKGSSQ